MSKVYLIANENIVHILEYLRATELAVCSEVDTTVFSKSRIRCAVKHQLLTLYQPIFLSMPIKTPFYIDSDYRIDVLFVKEVKTILAALTYSPSILTKGYWASTSWISNAKKYFEAIILPDISMAPGKKTKCKGGRKAKIRQRRGSDALPPWPCINADILCTHGCMSSTNGSDSLTSACGSFFVDFIPRGLNSNPRIVLSASCVWRQRRTRAASVMSGGRRN